VIPVHRDWRLNERHYGALQGLNKSETADKFGEDQVKIFGRRSYNIPAAAAGQVRSALAGPRPALRWDLRGRTSLDRVPQRHRPRAFLSALAPDHRAMVKSGNPVVVCGAWQQPARAGEVSRRHLRRRDRRMNISPPAPAGLRAGRIPQAGQALLSGRPGEDRSGDAGLSRPGQKRSSRNNAEFLRRRAVWPTSRTRTTAV